MEAYLLRCAFLKAEQSLAMRLLVPSLTINTTASNTAVSLLFLCSAMEVVHNRDCQEFGFG